MLYDNKLRLRRVQGTFGQDFLSEILSHLLNMPPTGLGDGKDRDRDRDPHLSQHNAGLQQTVLRPKQELALGKFMGKMLVFLLTSEHCRMFSNW